MHLMGSGDRTPKVSIILVNWIGWRDSIPCLDSVFQIAYPNYDVILVDNDSDDESVEKISSYAASNLVSGTNHFERRPDTAQVNSVRYSRSLAERGGDGVEHLNLPRRIARGVIQDELFAPLNHVHVNRAAVVPSAGRTPNRVRDRSRSGP